MTATGKILKRELRVNWGFFTKKIFKYFYS
jgi:hypothetical protein